MNGQAHERGLLGFSRESCEWPLTEYQLTAVCLARYIHRFRSQPPPRKQYRDASVKLSALLPVRPFPWSPVGTEYRQSHSGQRHTKFQSPRMGECTHRIRTTDG